jgi:hypothetical protein
MSAAKYVVDPGISHRIYKLRHYYIPLSLLVTSLFNFVSVFPSKVNSAGVIGSLHGLVLY